mgnify:CR=1 FL=1
MHELTNAAASESKKTIAALEKLLESGRRLILLSGRELPDLEGRFDRLDLFTYVVAENGGVLHDPASGAVRALAPPPPFAGRPIPSVQFPSPPPRFSLAAWNSPTLPAASPPGPASWCRSRSSPLTWASRCSERGRYRYG